MSFTRELSIPLRINVEEKKKESKNLEKAFNSIED